MDAFNAWVNRKVGNIEATVARHPTETAMVVGVVVFFLVVWVVS